MSEDTDSREDEGGESACPIPDPWELMAVLDVHPFGDGDVSEDTGDGDEASKRNGQPDDFGARTPRHE
jgi:hypothetical protein